MKEVKEKKVIEEKKEEIPLKPEVETEKKDSGKPGLKCLSCNGVVFENNALFRTHFKTPWHNFNLKRKIEVDFFF